MHVYKTIFSRTCTVDFGSVKMLIPTFFVSGPKRLGTCIFTQQKKTLRVREKNVVLDGDAGRAV